MLSFLSVINFECYLHDFECYKRRDTIDKRMLVHRRFQLRASWHSGGKITWLKKLQEIKKMLIFFFLIRSSSSGY